jgi:hypothetical protein
VSEPKVGGSWGLVLQVPCFQLPTSAPTWSLGVPFLTSRSAGIRCGVGSVVRSKAEAIEWASRAPFSEGTQLEIRQVFEDDDFAASDPTGELRAQDEKRRH